MITDIRGSRVLVAGAGGLIGAWLVPALIREGADVHLLVRPGHARPTLDGLTRITVHPGSVADGPLVQRIVLDVRPDCVINLAVARGDDRAALVQTNVLGTVNLLRACRTLDYRRFLQLGSSIEYGQCAGRKREDASHGPTTFYGATKREATRWCQHVASRSGKPVVVLRPFYVYGPGEPRHRLISAAIRSALDGVALPLTRTGIRHDFVFVTDVADACLRALTAPGLSGQIINIGSGCDTANEQVVEIVERLTGRRIATTVGAFAARPWDSSSWVADIGKAAACLGWRPRHSLESGIAKTIDRVMQERQRAAHHAASEVAV